MGSKEGNHASFRTYQPSPNLLFDVVPINPLDTTNLVKPWVVTYSIYLNGRLDSTKLHDSLESLISKKHRILGARLVSAVFSCGRSITALISLPPDRGIGHLLCAAYRVVLARYLSSGFILVK
jgi:hypothetical protein